MSMWSSGLTSGAAALHLDTDEVAVHLLAVQPDGHVAAAQTSHRARQHTRCLSCSARQHKSWGRGRGLGCTLHLCQTQGCTLMLPACVVNGMPRNNHSSSPDEVV